MSLKCPKCGNSESFRIACQATVLLYFDGSDDAPRAEDPADVTWNDSAACTCSECSETGPVGAFKKAEG